MVRDIKSGIILRNATYTLQEYGTGTIPKYRTDQPTILRQFWYTITESETGETIIVRKTEDRSYLYERRQTTKCNPYYDVENWRKESPSWEEEQESEELLVKAEGSRSMDVELG